MTKCYPNPTRFLSVQRSKVEAEFSFSGGATTGNGVFCCQTWEPWLPLRTEKRTYLTPLMQYWGQINSSIAGISITCL